MLHEWSVGELCHVQDAWGKSVGADGKVLMLADGSALFTKVRPPGPTAGLQGWLAERVQLGDMAGTLARPCCASLE